LAPDIIQSLILSTAFAGYAVPKFVPWPLSGGEEGRKHQVPQTSVIKPKMWANGGLSGTHHEQLAGYVFALSEVHFLSQLPVLSGHTFTMPSICSAPSSQLNISIYLKSVGGRTVFMDAVFEANALTLTVSTNSQHSTFFSSYLLHPFCSIRWSQTVAGMAAAGWVRSKRGRLWTAAAEGFFCL
jgi:hypothetical protein